MKNHLILMKTSYLNKIIFTCEARSKQNKENTAISCDIDNIKFIEPGIFILIPLIFS